MRKFEVEYVTFEELYEAYLDCRKRKRRTANACRFELQEDVALYKLWEDLNNQLYSIGRSITFVVDKPVKREIFAADFKDRIVHHLIVNRILDLLEKDFINDSYSCRVGKGTEFGVQQCSKYIAECSENYTKDAYVFKGDLKSFFMTINKDMLHEKLTKLLTDSKKFSEHDLQYNLWLLKLIIFNEPQKNCIRKQDASHWDDLPKSKSLFYTDSLHGLPIGNLTSQLFANFYLSYFDHWMNEELGFKYYGRYVDDFFIVCQDKQKILDAIPLIREKLKEVGVTLHPKKIYIQHVSKGVKFIGSIIKPNRIYIAKRTIGNAWLGCKRIYYTLKKHKGRQDAIEHCVSVMNSYLGFMAHKKTFHIREKILKWEFLKPLWEYSYPDDSCTKVMLFKEYSKAVNTKYKHLSKVSYDVMKNIDKYMQDIWHSIPKEEKDK